jgi:hypothetical protein
VKGHVLEGLASSRLPRPIPVGPTFRGTNAAGNLTGLGLAGACQLVKRRSSAWVSLWDLKLTLRAVQGGKLVVRRLHVDTSAAPSDEGPATPAERPSAGCPRCTAR